MLLGSQKTQTEIIEGVISELTLVWFVFVFCARTDKTTPGHV